MRHVATLEFSELITIDEKIIFINAIREDQEFSVVDISSEIDNGYITSYFTTEDGDKGRLQIDKQKITISTNLSFTRLTEMYDYTALYFTETLIDLVHQHNAPPVDDVDEPPTA